MDIQKSEKMKFGGGNHLVYPEIDSHEVYSFRMPIWMKTQLQKKYGRGAPGLLRYLLVKHAGLERPENE